jgi:excisionase family DNA binding protein
MTIRDSTRTPNTPSSNLLTAEQVADRWQVPVAHVYRLAREGKVQTVRLGRYRRWRMADIEHFEQEGGADA